MVSNTVSEMWKKTIRSYRKAFVFKEDSSVLQVIIPLKEINTDLQPVTVLSLIQLYLSAAWIWNEKMKRAVQSNYAELNLIFAIYVYFTKANSKSIWNKVSTAEH